MTINKSTCLKPPPTLALHPYLALYGPFVGWLRLTNDVNVVQVLLAHLDHYILDVSAVNAWLTCKGG